MNDYDRLRQLLLHDETAAIGKLQQQVEELLNTCKMVCSVVAINGGLLHEHRVNVGKSNESVDQASFEKKLNQLVGFPVHIIADISVQWAWFNERVNNLFKVADIKNG